MKTTFSRVEQGFGPALKDYLERRLQPLGYMFVLQGRTSGAEARIVPALHAGLKACSTRFMNNAI